MIKKDMTMKNSIKTIYATLFLSVCGLIAVSCTKEDTYSELQHAADGFIISAVNQNMLIQQVETRSNINKTDEEQKINQLYLFFFDESGYYITSDVSNSLFKGYMEPARGTTDIVVPTEAFSADNTAAKNVKVYALANIASEVLIDNNQDGYPDNFPSEGKEGKSPQKLLEEFRYAPLDYGSYNRPDITKLPDEGMPMIGQNTTTVDLTSKGSLTIELKAMMARIDVKIHVESEQTGENNYPRLQMANWGVYNMPSVTPFVEKNNESILNQEELINVENIQNTEVVYNHGEDIDITFYMFENMQPTNGETIEYPEGTSPDDYQRWKPKLANDKATYFKMLAYYSTYNEDGSGNATYEATFTFYLGANHYNDFNVVRNRHYLNDIKITGLTAPGTNAAHITFDARINITEQNNPYYISMLREREHDAHFNVTPMDIYLFDTEYNPQMTVTIEDADNKSWIRMERIPATNMENGTVPTEGIAPGGPELLSSNNKPWHAGNGKRKYFTTDLMNILNQDYNKSDVIKNSRDRIYFYIDENLSLSDRQATIKLVYTDDKLTKPKERIITIVQHGLKKVEVYERDDDGNIVYDKNGQPIILQTIYIEAYEEYLNHHDPLDEFNESSVYDGLEWGLNEIYLNDNSGFSGDWQNVYLNGLDATNNIINRASQQKMDLNTPPLSAAQYCNNKNKRNDDGIVPVTDYGWFLPGISQLESILTKYYNDYEEFQKRFYWSSSAGKRKWMLSYPENNERARATKANQSGGFVKSDWNNIYENENSNGGSAPRTGVYLRIRAAYIPAKSVTIK